jgi:F420-dependent methylenetetrahydromethanopterin dehydrogenase
MQIKRREAEIQAAIVKALSKLGFLVIHIPNQATKGRQRYSGLLPGAPDLIVIGDNKVWFMEVKNEKGRQSLAQAIVQRQIEERGFGYYIVRSVDDALKAVGYDDGA